MTNNAVLSTAQRGGPARVRALAAAAISLLFVYYEIYRWIPLGRWNWAFAFPVQNDQFYPDIVIGVLLAWFAFSFATGRRISMAIGSALLTLWVVVHSFDWWIPYLRDLPQNAGRYSFYQPHTQILPVVGHHYPPDAGHVILDLLLFPAWLLSGVASAMDTLQRRTAQPTPP